MAIPEKFRPLVEAPPSPLPTRLWLAHAVCVMEEASCGWAGWILDGVVSASAGQENAEDVLAADYSQRCPRCGKTLFRTGVDLPFSKSMNEESPFAKSDYVTKPIEYK